MNGRLFCSAMLSAVAALTLAVSCSPPIHNTPAVYAAEKERTIPKPFDAVWQSAVEWFATHNTPIKNLDKASGLISTEYSLSMDEAAAQMDCGSGDTTFMGKVELVEGAGNFNIVVKKQDESSTKVTVNVFFTCTVNKYRYENLLSSEYVLESSTKVDCLSKGTLEKQILDYIMGAPQQPQVEAPPPPAPPPPPPRGECTSNDECRAGRVCRDGSCAYPGCMKDVDCPPTQLCEQGVCVAPASDRSPACAKDTDCQGDQVCEQGSCVAPQPTSPPPP